jgi:hypothetical protein
MPAAISIHWPDELNEHGRRMLWFGSWLIGEGDNEGGWFYSGRGGERARYEAPAAATGLRIRRWPNEGFEPEYADVLSLDGVAELAADALAFDRRQLHSHLGAEYE